MDKVSYCRQEVKDLVCKYTQISGVDPCNFIDEWESQVRTNITSKVLALMLFRLYHHSRGFFQHELARINNKIMHYENLGSGVVISSRIKSVKEAFSPSNCGANSYYPLDEAQTRKNTVKELNENGYSIASFNLSIDLVRCWREQTYQFKSFTIRTSAEEMIQNQKLWNNSNIDDSIVTAYASMTDVLGLVDIDKVVFSEKMLKIARQYLGVQTVYLANVQLWYSFKSETPNNESAQYFHFDATALKWLKVFIYLNDVDDRNGPHVAVMGSHKPASKPLEITAMGYSRISDEVIKTIYGEKVKSFHAKRGSIIFGDTNAFHKGARLVKGYRLCLAIDYCTDSCLDLVRDY